MKPGTRVRLRSDPLQTGLFCHAYSAEAAVVLWDDPGLPEEAVLLDLEVIPSPVVQTTTMPAAPSRLRTRAASQDFKLYKIWTA